MIEEPVVLRTQGEETASVNSRIDDEFEKTIASRVLRAKGRVVWDE